MRRRGDARTGRRTRQNLLQTRLRVRRGTVLLCVEEMQLRRVRIQHGDSRRVVQRNVRQRGLASQRHRAQLHWRIRIRLAFSPSRCCCHASASVLVWRRRQRRQWCRRVCHRVQTFPSFFFVCQKNKSNQKQKNSIDSLFHFIIFILLCALLLLFRFLLCCMLCQRRFHLTQSLHDWRTQRTQRFTRLWTILTDCIVGRHAWNALDLQQNNTSVRIVFLGLEQGVCSHFRASKQMLPATLLASIVETIANKPNTLIVEYKH
jgi:succinate dehydrogenase hydrophobic anchor subunit